MFPLKPDERTTFLIAAGCLAAASIALLQLPLFNYLGYEFSASIALLLPLVNGAYTMRTLVRRWPIGASVTTHSFTETVRDLLVQNAALLLIPFAAALASGIFVKNCSYGEGMIYYILLPVVTTFWLASLASICVALFGRPYLWFAGAILFTIAHPLLLGYFSPAVYSYNLIYGFFPGLTYDESLQLSWRLILFRYLTFLLAALFLLVAEFAVSYRKIGAGLRGLPVVLKNLRFHRQGRLLIAAVALQLLLGWLFRVPLGFESTSSSIARSLGASYSTSHFDIWYPPGFFSPEEIRWVAAMHEFRYDQVRSALRVTSGGRIGSFLYPDADTKRRSIGAGNTDIAKPWRGEIHLNADSWEGTLRHELVHVMAGEFGMPVIRAHYNTGLVEGLATAVDDDFGNRTLDEYAAAMMKFRLVENPSALIRFSGFATQASSVSYVMMGSFCQFLIRSYGIDRFKEAYSGGSPEEAFGHRYDELVSAWQDSLSGVEVPEGWKAHVNYYFRRPSIFAKVCARSVANRNEDGMRFLARKEPLEALGRFQSALAISWNTGSYAGMVRSAFYAGRYDSVRQMMLAGRGDSAETSLAGVLPLYADASWLKGDTATAARVCRAMVALDLTERYTESALIRESALGDSLLAQQLPEMLTASAGDSALAAVLEKLRLQSRRPLLSYVRAKVLLRMGRFEEVSALLGSLTAPLGPLLESGKNRMMAEAYFRQRDWDHAAAHYQKVSASALSEASRRRAEDDLERCAWFAAHQEILGPE